MKTGKLFSRFMVFVVSAAMLFCAAYVPGAGTAIVSAASENKVEIVGSPTAYIQTGGETVFSVQVKNISGSELKGVTMIESPQHTTKNPISGLSDTWPRFLPAIEKKGYPVSGAVWDSAEEGYTIGAGKTATLWFKANSRGETAGTYQEWIRFGDVHTELLYGVVPITVTDQAYSGKCSVDAAVYDPKDAAVTFGTSSDYARSISEVPLGSTISFGTIDLSKNTNLTAEKTYYTRNTSPTGKDEHGNSPDISVDLFVCSPENDNPDVEYPFSCNTNLSSGMHWAPLPPAPMSADRYYSAQTGIKLDASNFVAGTYQADFTMGTVPYGVKVNGGSIRNNGLYSWPVKVTLNGINPRIPKAPAGLKATPGNGQVELVWKDPKGADEDTCYEIYRRSGSESNKANLDNAAFNWGPYEHIGSCSPNSGGSFLFVDGTAKNNKTYTYIVIAGKPYQAYPAASDAVKPLSDYTSRLLPPERVFAQEEIGGVNLDWEMNEKYGGDQSDGSSMVDHFNIYRDGTLVAQVKQNAVNAVPEYGWGPSPDHPDEYTYHLLKTTCSWTAFFETPVLNQNYRWQVSAVSKNGVEGYLSEAASGGGISSGVFFLGHNINYDADNSFFHIEPLIARYYNLSRIDFWRAEGEQAPDITKAPRRSEVSTGYGIDGIYDDKVSRNKTYTYTFRAEDEEGHVSDPYTFTVKSADAAGTYYTDYGSVSVEWQVRSGKEAQMEWYCTTNDNYNPIGTYKVYRNRKLIKTYTMKTSDSAQIKFRDDPGTDGTYVYRVDKVLNGVTVRGRDCMFTRNTAKPDPDSFLKVPDAPFFDVRITGGVPVLRWAQAETGGKADGFHIYRKDAGELRNGSYTETYGYGEQRWNNMRYLSVEGTAVSSFADRYGELQLKEKKARLEGVSWYEDACPHEYWVTAFNAAGESRPSKVFSFAFEGLDEIGNPIPPSGEDEFAPAAPLISKLWVDWEDNSDQLSSWDDMIGGQLHVSWNDPEATAQSIVQWDVFFSGLHLGNEDRQTLYAWQATQDPKATKGYGEFAPYCYVSAEPGDSGDYGRDVKVTVQAMNTAGASSSEPETLKIVSFPRLRALAGDGKVKLEWTDLLRDPETKVLTFEIWRKGEYGRWQKIKELNAVGLGYEKTKDGADRTDRNGVKNYAFYDESAENGWNYQYRIIAKCADGLDRASVVREAEPAQNATSDVPGAPQNLKAEVANGVVTFFWDPPAEGSKPQYYQMVYEYFPPNSDSPVWKQYAAGQISPPTTSVVWSPDEAGTYRCFVYSYSYIGDERVPEMAAAWETDDLEKLYPTASNIVTVTITKAQMDERSYDAPGDFSLSADPGENQVVLKWTASKNATFYEVERFGRKDSSEQKLVTLPASVRTFTDTSAEPGILYEYRVTARNTSGRGTYKSAYARAEGKSHDEAIASYVAEQIAALPDPKNITKADEEQVREVQELYEALTEKQKSCVEAALKEKMEESVDAIELPDIAERYGETAAPVRDLIDALPAAGTVTEDDAAAIEAARKAYQGLPYDARRLLKEELEKLKAAEKQLEKIRREAEGGEDPAPSEEETKKTKNPLKVVPKTVTLKYSGLKKKTQTIAGKKALKVTNAKGTVTYSKVSGNRKITINKKTGAITVKKGLKKSTYILKVKVTAKGTSEYAKGSVTKKVRIRVK